MSDPCHMLRRMTKGVDEDTLTLWLTGEGFSLVSFDGDGKLWGYTDWERREVGLWHGLLERQRVPTLMHECVHVHRRDECRQSQAVEDQINETVARYLVDPIDYAWAEAQYGWSTGGIAAALELPRWVIQAYRSTLAKRMAKPGVETPLRR